MSKNRTQKILRSVLFLAVLLALPVGIYYVNEHFAQKRTPSENIYGGNEGVAEDNDLSNASPEEFVKAFKYQVLKDASVEKTSVGPGIVLGLFWLKNERGERVHVCEKYPTIDILFAAEGIAFSGEIPRMIVRGPCLVSSDQRHIEPLPVPFQTILTSPVSQFEFHNEIPAHPGQVKIFFRHVFEFWPREWTWVGVSFYGAANEPALHIDGYEVLSVMGAPVVISPHSNE